MPGFVGGTVFACEKLDSAYVAVVVSAPAVTKSMAALNIRLQHPLALRQR
jgi:broad specificity polyphosphatase/5'/3'-nucleotidase SurE